MPAPIAELSNALLLTACCIHPLPWFKSVMIILIIKIIIMIMIIFIDFNKKHEIIISRSTQMN